MPSNSPNIQGRQLLKDFYVIGYFSKPEEYVLTALENTADTKHLTILPRFTMEEINIDSFSESLAATLKEMNATGEYEYPVDTIRREEFVSPMGRHVVQIVEKTDEISQLHTAVLEIAEKFSASFQNPAFSGEGYNPHISHAEEGFSSHLSHVALTTYQDVPFRTEIKVLFDLNGNAVSSEDRKVAA
jgi:hypothetical protein